MEKVNDDSSSLSAAGLAFQDVGEEEIGKKIRDFRAARGFSIRELAARAALSAGAISQLERGIGSPSVKSLRAISRALEVPFVCFFDEDRESEEVVRRTRQRRTINFGKTGTTKEILSLPGLLNLEILLVRVAPKGSSGSEMYSHDGEEGGVVISGVLELWVDGKRHLLNPGDSFGFKSSLQHRFANGGGDELQVIWVNTQPQY